MLKFIDDSMAGNDEITARQKRILLLEKWPGLQISVNTYKRMRKHLGWVAGARKAKKKEINLTMLSGLMNVLFCSVQLDSKKRLYFRKKKNPNYTQRSIETIC